MDANETYPSVSQAPYAKLLPLIRERLWPPDGQPPPAWDERREGSVIKRLLIHRSVSQLEVAILGLAHLRDKGIVQWLKPGAKVTSRALYNSRTGVSQMFEVATAAYWKMAKRKSRGRIERIGDIIWAIARQSPTYRTYLQSPAWRARRQLALQAASFRCQRCSQIGGNLEVHHLTYTNLGYEADDELEVLCYWCHRLADDERRDQ